MVPKSFQPGFNSTMVHLSSSSSSAKTEASFNLPSPVATGRVRHLALSLPLCPPLSQQGD